MGDRSLFNQSHPSLLRLTIPPWVGTMSNDNSLGHRQGRNGEFCITVGPVSRTAGILAYIWLKMLAAIGLAIRLTYSVLIGLTFAGLNHCKWDELLYNSSCCLLKNLLLRLISRFFCPWQTLVHVKLVQWIDSWSTNQLLLDCPRFSTEFGKRSFSYLAPTVLGWFASWYKALPHRRYL